MPLVKGYGDKAVGKNIGAEIRSGKPKKQAVAIAMSVARDAAKKAGNKKKAAALQKVKRT